MGARHETLGLYGLAVVALGASGLAWASAPPPEPDEAVELAVVAEHAPGLRTAPHTEPAGERTSAPSVLVALPPVVPVFRIDEPVATGSIAELVLPEPPAASAVVRPEDAVAGAIQNRLGQIAKAISISRLPRRDREAVAEFYASRDGAPLWIGTNGWTARGAALIARLGRATEEGLDPAGYAPPIMPVPGRPDTPAELADAELKLSALAALYARDARGGRIDPARLSALLTPKLDLPAADAVLHRLAAASDVGAALAAYNPDHAGYRALRAKLADVRRDRPSPAPMVRGPAPRDLVTHSIAVLDDVPVLRSPSINPARLESDIIANMERWRWLPAELGAKHVSVNIPEFRLQLIEGGRVAHEARVITGKPETPTPVFSGVMEYAVVNPSWYIPPSILKKEILPGLAADPSYAERRGYQVIRRGNQISVRQPPGERNALGFIKFMFPNGHAVYLHDTPNRNLFGSGRRAFSHGCVRVENPFQLADFVLGSEWTESRLKRLIGRGERTIFLPEKLPVHLTYFTIEVAASGELRSFEDIYGHNRRVRAALGLGV